MTRRKTTVLIADDHAVVRSGLRKLFESSKNYDIIGEASDGDEAIRLVSRHQPDIAIIDISMPRRNGIEVARLIRESYPKTRILILTIHEEEEYILEMIRAGANGYVLKNAEADQILAAVKAISSGERFFSPGISNILIEGYLKTVKEQHAAHTTLPHQLSQRETEILRFVAHGFTNKRIAEKLSISVRTVMTHRNNIMRKLNIHSTAGLVKYAFQFDVITTKP